MLHWRYQKMQEQNCGVWQNPLENPRMICMSHISIGWMKLKEDLNQKAVP